MAWDTSSSSASSWGVLPIPSSKRALGVSAGVMSFLAVGAGASGAVSFFAGAAVSAGAPDALERATQTSALTMPGAMGLVDVLQYFLELVIELLQLVVLLRRELLDGVGVV